MDSRRSSPAASQSWVSVVSPGEEVSSGEPLVVERVPSGPIPCRPVSCNGIYIATGALDLEPWTYGTLLLVQVSPVGAD